MKWVGISGGWRRTNQKVEDGVRKTVREIIQRGDGIVSGGALGVDFIATDEALKYDPAAGRIKIFLPTTLEKYSEHYRKHAELGDVTSEDVENLIALLTRLKRLNPKSLIENPDTNFTEENKKERYYERNGSVVNASDELVAFHIRTEMSEGLGTNDTIEKAKAKGIPVKAYTYDLSSMHYLYHRVPENMKGNILYPLNELKNIFPEIYLENVKKYKGREETMEHRIPILNCLWKDVIHMSSVHPSEVKKELGKNGQVMFKTKFFEIDPFLLEPEKTIIYLYGHNKREDKLKEDNFAKYDPNKIQDYSLFPEETKRYYAEIIRDGRKPLLWHRIPHFLYKGNINVLNLNILEV